MKRKPFFSICLPIYKGSSVLYDCLFSIAKQKFNDFEIIIGEDTPSKFKNEIKTSKRIINSFHFKNIKYIKNVKNLGYPHNLRSIVSHAKGEVLFLMGQDDILAKDSLQKTRDAFYIAKNIGAVTRPYFWYDDDINQPVRIIRPPNIRKNIILSIFQNEDAVRYIFDSLGQLSGLALRKNLITNPFHHDVFPAHIYPFASILKTHKCVYLKDYTVAVRIKSSQSRHKSSIYDTSPLETWINMFNTVYSGEKFKKVRQFGIKHITSNYVGFIQLKNYGPKGSVLREILKTIQYYPRSVLSIKFWFYSFLAFFTPKKYLQPLTDNYKKYILSKSIRNVYFNPIW